MHEHALMTDVTRKIEQTAREGGGDRVTRVVVTLGALSHFTPEHFREHFVDATRGTVAEGAEVLATIDKDIGSPQASGVVLESVELEIADPVEVELMCVAAIAKLIEIHDDVGAPVGRLEDGATVTLSFVPDAAAGDYLLVHLGIPVEIISPQDAQEALLLRSASENKGGGRA